MRDGLGGNPPPKKTRHVYVGVETVQEYDVTIEVIPSDEVTTQLREFIWGDSANFPEPVAMIDILAPLSWNMPVESGRPIPAIGGFS